MKVFISYAREDLEIAKKLRDDLEKAGISTWLDKENLLPGQNWRDVILREIRESRYFIALLSSRALSREGFVHKELKTALDFLDYFPSDRIFLIPVRIDDCQPTDEKLRYIHWADLFPSYQEGLNQILRVLIPEIKQSPNEIKPVPVVSPRIEDVAEEIIVEFEPVQKPEYQLRKELTTASGEEIKSVFRVKENRRQLEDIQNDFKDNGDGTITDYATGLMWQKSASEDHLDFVTAKEYIKELNKNKFAGHNDWRLPSGDELKSLRIHKKKSDDLSIDPIFDNKQRLCWIAADGTQYGFFFSGGIPWGKKFTDFPPYVRAVRSI